MTLQLKSELSHLSAVLLESEQKSQEIQMFSDFWENKNRPLLSLFYVHDVKWLTELIHMHWI